MKQHITPDQISEIDKRSKKAILRWWEPKSGDMALFGTTVGPITDEGDGYWHDLTSPDFDKNKCLPLLSIGQMIDFISKKVDPDFTIWRRRSERTGKWFWAANIKWIAKLKVSTDYVDWPVHTPHPEEEFCDLLWEIVKDSLRYSYAKKVQKRL